MKEEFLHFIWQQGLFNTKDLTTYDGKSLQILQKGRHNTEAGPDFLEAKLVIDDTTWFGSIEIHLKSSFWNAHGHEADARYNNVLLHVVFEHDADVYNEAGELIPVLELSGRISKVHIDKYELLSLSKKSLPCKDLLPEITDVTWLAWMDRLVVQRLQRKTADVELIHEYTQNHWLQTFFVLLAGYFGHQSNKLPMMELARSVGVKELLKLGDNQLALEAVLLGSAGLLPDQSDDAYIQTLVSEYTFWKKKLGLKQGLMTWNFGRVRPQNSPDRRIVQLASCISHIASVQNELLETGIFNWREINLTPSAYWKTHYTLRSGQHSRLIDCNLSKSFSDHLALNVHAPYVFFYASSYDLGELKKKVIQGLETLQPERNRITRLFEAENKICKTAVDSQAQVELFTQYCQPKKCVICNLGKTLISVK